MIFEQAGLWDSPECTGCGSWFALGGAFAGVGVWRAGGGCRLRIVVLVRLGGTAWVCLCVVLLVAYSAVANLVCSQTKTPPDCERQRHGRCGCIGVDGWIGCMAFAG